MSPKMSLKRPPWQHGARGEKTHPAQAASFLEFLSMKGVNDEIAPKAA